MNKATLKTILSGRISLQEIRRIAEWCNKDDCNKEILWQMAQSDISKTSVNALWILTHLRPDSRTWLIGKRNEMIELLLSSQDSGQKRLLLQILREQNFSSDEIPTDLLEYCLSKINSECEPYAIRASSIHIGFNLCRHYPELIAELRQHLELLEHQPLSPGLSSALRQTKAKIATLHKR